MKSAIILTAISLTAIPLRAKAVKDAALGSKCNCEAKFCHVQISFAELVAVAYRASQLARRLKPFSLLTLLGSLRGER